MYFLKMCLLKKNMPVGKIDGGYETACVKWGFSEGKWTRVKGSMLKHCMAETQS